MSIDWSKAPEGATHATTSGTFIREERGDRFVAYWEWLYEWVLIESGLEKDQLIERPKKPLTQAVFDGLPPEYRFAVIDGGEGGLAFAAVGRPRIEAKGGFLFWQKAHGDTNDFVDIGFGHETANWQNSLIERETVNPVSEQQDDTAQDLVNNPSHYTTGGIECIDAMQAMLSRDEFVGYLRGNIFKYQWRYKHKNGIEDLKKAQWYANRLIELESAK